MGVRFRRSIKIAPGVRLNLTKTGVGVTAGGSLARYSVHSSGRRTLGLSVPGTGAYYQQTSGGRTRSPSKSLAARASNAPNSGAPAQRPGSVDLAQVITKPGLLASGAEKAYHEGLLAYLRGDQEATASAFERALALDGRATSAHLFAGIAANALRDSAGAIGHLEAVVAAPQGLPDHYQAKYVPETRFSLSLNVAITDAVSASVPFGELAAVLALAEVYQHSGKLEDAIGLLQQVHDALPDPLVKLSMSDLLFADRDYEGVVETTVGVHNESDVDVEMLHLRGAALLALGYGTAALDAFGEALARTANRDPGLLNAVRYDRALAYDQLGDRRRARAELERLYAADPGFEDVKQRLAAMADASKPPTA